MMVSAPVSDLDAFAAFIIIVIELLFAIGILIFVAMHFWPVIFPKKHCGKKMRVVCNSDQRHFKCETCGFKQFGI